MRTRLLVWSFIPPILWMGLIVIGLVTSPEVCEQPATMHIVSVAALAVSLLATSRVATIRRSTPESLGLVGNVGFLIGGLFSAGIGLTWIMVGLGSCL